MGGASILGKSSFSEADQNLFRECFRHGKKIRRRDVECGKCAFVHFWLVCGVREGSNVLKLSFSVEKVSILG